jgi:hypothetical protein
VAGFCEEVKERVFYQTAGLETSEYLSQLGPCVSSSAVVTYINVVDFKTSVICVVNLF